MILIYVTCESKKQAEEIGKHLLKRRLCTCINIFENITSISWWPAKGNKLSKGNEAVLLVKTIEEKFEGIEKEVIKLHSWKVPCLFSIKINNVHKTYLNWLKGEII